KATVQPWSTSMLAEIFMLRLEEAARAAKEAAPHRPDHVAGCEGVLRVCPKTSGGITKFSEHEADLGKPQKRQRVAIEVLPILRKPSAAVEPSKGAFDDPTPWKHHESFRPIGALDDFSFELWQDPRQGLLKVRPLVATIGKELFQERVHPE